MEAGRRSEGCRKRSKMRWWIMRTWASCVVTCNWNPKVTLGERRLEEITTDEELAGKAASSERT